MPVEYGTVLFGVIGVVTKTGHRLRLNGAWGLKLSLLVLLINMLTGS